MRVRFALSGALLLLLGSYGISQEITATILGTVVDSSGAAISGATIIVVNTDQAVVLRGPATSRRGQYVVPLLPLGHYDVTGEAPGFNRTSQIGIQLSVNDRRTDYPAWVETNLLETHWCTRVGVPNSGWCVSND